MMRVTRLRRGARLYWVHFVGFYPNQRDVIQRGTVDYVLSNGQIEFSEIERLDEAMRWRPIDPFGRYFGFQFTHARTRRNYTSFRISN